MIKRLMIIKDDNKVRIDDLVFFNIDCSGLPENFNILYWYPEEGKGEISWKGNPRPPNTEIYDLTEYQPYIDAFYAKKKEQDDMIAAEKIAIESGVYAWAEIRDKRNYLLMTTDNLALSDRWPTFSPEKQKEIADYRQALRDLPGTITDPFNVTWPTPPEV